jgi:hypothetical protein
MVINEIVLTSANFWTLAERIREQDLFMTFRLKIWAEIWLEKVIFWLVKYPKKFFGAPPKIAGAPLKIGGAPRKNDWNLKKTEKKFLFSEEAADRLKQFETLLMVRNGNQWDCFDICKLLDSSWTVSWTRPFHDFSAQILAWNLAWKGHFLAWKVPKKNFWSST